MISEQAKIPQTNKQTKVSEKRKANKRQGREQTNTHKKTNQTNSRQGQRENKQSLNNNCSLLANKNTNIYTNNLD